MVDDLQQGDRIQAMVALPHPDPAVFQARGGDYYVVLMLIVSIGLGSGEEFEFTLVDRLDFVEGVLVQE